MSSAANPVVVPPPPRMEGSATFYQQRPSAYEGMDLDAAYDSTATVTPVQNHKPVEDAIDLLIDQDFQQAVRLTPLHDEENDDPTRGADDDDAAAAVPKLTTTHLPTDVDNLATAKPTPIPPPVPAQPPRLYYFPMNCRQLAIEYAFKLGNIPYERVAIPMEHWPLFKGKMPFGKLPVLELNGCLIPESNVCLVYAASRAGLLPSNPGTLAVSRAIADECSLIMDAAVEACFASDEAPPAPVQATPLPAHLPDHQPRGFVNDQPPPVTLVTPGAPPVGMWSPGASEISTDFLKSQGEGVIDVRPTGPSGYTPPDTLPAEVPPPAEPGFRPLPEPLEDEDESPPASPTSPVSPVSPGSARDIHVQECKKRLDNLEIRLGFIYPTHEKPPTIFPDNVRTFADCAVAATYEVILKNSSSMFFLADGTIKMKPYRRMRKICARVQKNPVLVDCVYGREHTTLGGIDESRFLGVVKCQAYGNEKVAEKHVSEIEVTEDGEVTEDASVVYACGSQGLVEAVCGRMLLQNRSAAKQVDTVILTDPCELDPILAGSGLPSTEPFYYKLNGKIFFGFLPLIHYIEAEKRADGSYESFAPEAPTLNAQMVHIIEAFSRRVKKFDSPTSMSPKDFSHEGQLEGTLDTLELKLQEFGMTIDRLPIPALVYIVARIAEKISALDKYPLMNQLAEQTVPSLQGVAELMDAFLKFVV